MSQTQRPPRGSALADRNRFVDTDTFAAVSPRQWTLYLALTQPRAVAELAAATKLDPQMVLQQLEIMRRLGLLSRTKRSGEYLWQRCAYVTFAQERAARELVASQVSGQEATATTSTEVTERLERPPLPPPPPDTPEASGPRWVFGALLTATVALVFAVGVSVSSMEGDDEGISGSLLEAGTPTSPVQTTAPSPTPTAQQDRPGKTGRGVGSDRSDGGPRSAGVDPELAALGLDSSTVTEIDAIAQATGYSYSGLGVEESAWLAVAVCERVRDGQTTWKAEIDEAVFAGAPVAQARRWNDYLRSSLCPTLP